MQRISARWSLSYIRRLAAVVLIGLFPRGEALAQSLPVKAPPPPVAVDICEIEPDGKATPPSAGDRAEADRLAAAAAQAAILGDLTAARDDLARAAALDPTAPAIAYHLARTHDDLGDPAQAAREYCRYLRLEPDAPDAAEIRDRVDRLAVDGGLLPVDEAAQAYNAGIAHYDAGRFTQAAEAFSSVLLQDSTRAAAYYNRGVVYAAQGRDSEAIGDLETYLALSPEAADRAEVLAWIDARRAAPGGRLSPGGVLATGLVLPGAGQFRTERPLLGVLVLGVAGGAIAAGVLQREVNVACLSTPTNGECPADQILSTTTERPYLVPAIGVAAAVTLVGAIEGFLAARRSNGEPAVRRSDAAATIGPRLGLRLGGPAPAVEVAWFRLSF